MEIKNKKPIVKKTSKDDKTLWIIIGVTALGLGGIGFWYYKKRKSKLEMLSIEEDLDREIASTIANNTIGRSTTTGRPTRFRCKSSKYPLQYGTCFKDVKILQSYLSKIYKADLGRSGRSRDGVDGIFGNKTNRAAKKHLQRTSFSKQDIDGMRTAIKTIKR
ncbi:LPXTG cell wall anchor domain-containing protein [Aquimarina sp. TRL1]|uniref:peptidoglycan-binding domain-containing protein n=1 Tax=Aquimarina sp. (strain TRL1) TaxID=2736252 RepID=UPI00158AF15E|nr:LPXTG cell wall anchor domain-containing protein [Aquimarina sp. TRL1]QKX04131.1 LPXTG cell wall anchor domain-containing protein [Aquimarina sp. TRL1]